MSGAWIKRATARVWFVLKATYERYDERHGDLLAAAFSFYSMLSIVPLAVIAVTVAGLVVDPGTARSALLGRLERALGREVAQVVVSGIEAAQTTGGGIGALVALALLLWGASRLFTVLQDALNAMWGLQPRPSASTLDSIRRVALKRLLSFGMVIACGALLLASLIVQTTLSSVSNSVLAALGLTSLQHGAASIQSFALEVIVIAIAFTGIFRVLPDARVRWRDAFLGALITAAMVLAGTRLLSLYLARIAPNWLQGAVGSVAAFLIWSNYLAQVFLLGAALTRVRATREGRSIEPEAHAQVAT